MNDIRDYRLVIGIRVDVENGDVQKGYFIEKVFPGGEKSIPFFIEGSVDKAIAHIRKTHGIIDKARLLKLSEFLIEGSEIEPEPEKEKDKGEWII
jgi:hypothetical protein